MLRGNRSHVVWWKKRGCCLFSYCIRSSPDLLLWLHTIQALYSHTAWSRWLGKEESFTLSFIHDCYKKILFFLSLEKEQLHCVWTSSYFTQTIKRVLFLSLFSAPEYIKTPPIKGQMKPNVFLTKSQAEVMFFSKDILYAGLKYPNIMAYIKLAAHWL